MITHTLIRRLSEEVDQLLGQIAEPNSYADYDVPRSIYGNRGQQRLRFEERALQGRLDELSNKRDKLANELHGLISQVSEIGGAEYHSQCRECYKEIGLTLFLQSNRDRQSKVN